MGVWEQGLANKIKQIPSFTKVATKFFEDHKGHLLKYRGGIPVGMLAATAAIESNGKMVPGDPSLGEFGYFQVARQTEIDFGLPKDIRKTPEGNIFLACLEYNAEAQRLAINFPDLIENGSEDQYKLARLVFSIGRHGTYACIKAAKPKEKGNVFQAVVDWSNRTGAIPLGHSPAGKIKMRINNIDKVVWVVGQAVAPWQTAGTPEKIPAPQGLQYLVPKDVRPYLTTHTLSPLVTWGTVAMIIALAV